MLHILRTALGAKHHQMPPIRDACSSVREFYNGLLKACGSNKWVTLFLFGSPVYWQIGAIILYQAVWNESAITASYFKQLISSPVYTILSILSCSWLLAIFSVLRFWPNLLSISVFVYEAFGHWCLVTLAVLLYIYGTPSFMSDKSSSSSSPPQCLCEKDSMGNPKYDNNRKPIGCVDCQTVLMRMYFAFVAMPIFLLLLSAEILRTHRSKMFSHNVSQDRMIENAASAPVELQPAEL
jgi:hypothetical protein